MIGDYGVEENVSSEDASKTIEWAEEFIRVAEDYFTGNNTE